MFNLAYLLEEGGDDIQKDIGRGKELYERATAEAEDVESMVSLSLIYEAEGDMYRAVQLCEQAVQLGSP